MAGAKETPRQKMIGMMYLVLTALLALNVSKSILDAFVTIEENVQKSNIVQANRGTEFVSEVRAELVATKGDDQEVKRRKLQSVVERMQELDTKTEEFIRYIDELKLNILKAAGEDVKHVKNGDALSIIWKERNGIIPMRMNLSAVCVQDRYDESMHVMGIADNIRQPTGEGLELWKRLNAYREDVVELTGTYTANNGVDYRIAVEPINNYSNYEDLVEKVEEMVDANRKVNVKEDRQVLIDLYLMLTKRERNTVHDQANVHWIGMTFDHAPIVAAIAALSSLQNDVLSARALALGQMKSRLGLHEYGFNSILPLAYGQPIANSGDSVYLQVMMAAYDSENQPVVMVNDGAPEATIRYPQNGQAIVGFKVSGSGEQVLKGTVAIRNRSGVMKTEPWEYTVKVMKPIGAISLPNLNVLYRRYDNAVNAVASGFDETILSGSNVTISRTGKSWVIQPGSGRESTLTVTGKNTVTGKTTALLTQHYKVLPLPDATLYWGSSKSGEIGTTAATKLFVRYDPSIPLQVNFRIISWECSVTGRPYSGSGNDISAVLPILRQAPKGTSVYFNCKVQYPGEIRIVTGMYKL